MHSSPAKKYAERYEQGVIIRDNDLSAYNHFLHNLGEEKTVLELVREYLQRKKTCHVLDIGCGTGRAMHELKQHAGAGVHTAGIDLLPIEHPSFLDEFTRGDIHHVPIKGANDLIFSFRALHEMGDFKSLFPRITQALTLGGRAYLWVRMRDLVNGKIDYVGEMNEHEEETLQEMGTLSKLNGCKILVEPVKQTLFQEEGVQTAVTGYVVLLFRPSA